MLNHIVVMGRLTRDPELRKRIFLMSLRGAIPLSLRQSISQKAARLSFPAVCRSGTGKIKKATNAARQRFLPKTSILVIARRRTTAVLLPHPRRALVRLHSRAVLRPTLAAHSPAALCRTSAGTIKLTVQGGIFPPCLFYGGAK